VARVLLRTPTRSGAGRPEPGVEDGPQPPRRARCQKTLPHPRTGMARARGGGLGRRRRYWIGGVALAVALAVAPGCSEELGPERWETARVSGVVRHRGQPVGGGFIEFLPAEGTVGNLRSAPIGPDGRFEVEGVAVGVNRVGLVGAPLATLEARREFDPLGSTVRRTIPRGGVTGLTIDLLEEMARA